MQQEVSIEGNTVISCSLHEEMPRYSGSIDEYCLVAGFEMNFEVSFHVNGLVIKVTTEREGICRGNCCARKNYKYSSEAKFTRIVA